MNAPDWKFIIVRIGPEEAATLLRGNEGNRRVRPGAVAKYATIMAEGHWLLTPEPIVVAKSGRLLNGQHRLHAVIKFGGEVRFLMVSNVDENVFPALDRGAIRTAADAIGSDKKTTEAARLICGLHYGFEGARITDDRIARVLAIIEADHSAILAETPTARRVFSSAPMRAAASIRLLAGYNREYILSTYRNLVLAQIGDLAPLPQSFFAAVSSGRVIAGGGHKQSELAARAWDVFDPAKRAQTKIHMRDPGTRLNEMRRIIQYALEAAE